MQKMKNIQRPEAGIWTGKVGKSGKMRRLQDRHLRIRHSLIRVPARVKLQANTNGFKWPLNRVCTIFVVFVNRRCLFIKKITQTAVINIVFQRIFKNLTFRMLVNTHFEKWPLQFLKTIYIVNIRGLEPRLRKMICSSTCLDIMRSNS